MFKSRCDQLPPMPAQSDSSLRPSKTGGVGVSSASVGAETRSHCGLHSKFNRRRAITVIKDMAYGYLTSFPHPENSSTDRECNMAAKSLVNGENPPPISSEICKPL